MDNSLRADAITTDALAHDSVQAPTTQDHGSTAPALGAEKSGCYRQPVEDADTPIDVTVVIPTFNGATRLPAVLERLRDQNRSLSCRWEVLVVDNNSVDQTAVVVEQFQGSWLQDVPLRYCFEGRQGLAYARQCGIEAARGHWVAFLDDDNLPDLDWVLEAHRFAQTHPHIGGFGGQIHGEYETSPPPHFKRIQSFLAIRERGTAAHAYAPETLSLPPGAALVVKREVWLQAVPRQLTLVGRVNGSYLAGEDYEALLHIHQGGWEIWYCPTMHTYHQIPASRLERPYLLKVVKGAGLCVCQLRLLTVPPYHYPWVMAKIMAGSLKRVLQLLWTYRRQLSTDLVAECEVTFWLNCLVSPLFYLRLRQR